MAPLKKLLKSIFIIVVIFSFAFCEGEQYDNLPPANINLKIDLNDAQFSDLQTPGNYVENVIGGIAGIIIYHELDGDYVAFDQACPYDFNYNHSRVHVVDIASGIARDSACGSEFSITNGGAVIKGPAKTGLRRYYTKLNPNTNILEITSYDPDQIK